MSPLDAVAIWWDAPWRIDAVTLVHSGVTVSGLMLVTRYRKWGWVVGAIAQAWWAAYGLASHDLGKVIMAGAVINYLRNLYLRRDETWGAILTGRELRRAGAHPSAWCCTHGDTPTEVTPHVR